VCIRAAAGKLPFVNQPSKRAIILRARYPVDTVQTDQESLGLVPSHHYDFVLTDLRMRAMDGVDEVKSSSPGFGFNRTLDARKLAVLKNSISSIRLPPVAMAVPRRVSVRPRNLAVSYASL
jgi:hypothetical protein